MRQHITTENMYEQRLLPEVVSDDLSLLANSCDWSRMNVGYNICLHTVHLHTLLC